MSTYGFRTFLKLFQQGGKQVFYEPFARNEPGVVCPSEMRTGFNDLIIQDRNEELGLVTEVTYFVLPSENVASLVRKVVVRNDSAKMVKGEILDGLPAIVPYGISNWLQKEMSNTMGAWMCVENLDKRIAFYRVQASVEDKPEVEEFASGNFYLCFTEKGDRAELLKPIVDPAVVFGSDTSFRYPERFLVETAKKLSDSEQITTGKQGCGFFATEFSLQPGEETVLYGLVGYADDVELINREANRLACGDYLAGKHVEAVELGSEITRPAVSRTAFPNFDLYCSQGFMDNCLRGGYPLVFPAQDGKHVYHIYARRHGDLERDYNFFVLSPERYAQGNGAYRDINQNRRFDVMCVPEVEDATVRTFVNLLQLDGYNPLELRPAQFVLNETGMDKVMPLVANNQAVRNLLVKPYTVGKILQCVETHSIEVNGDLQSFVETLLYHSRQIEHSNHQEGYWVDHWTYNLDLIDSYLTIYPDRKEEFLFDRVVYTYHDTAHYVVPREQKYVETGEVVRQFKSVLKDSKKAEMIAGREELPNAVRTEQGKGDVYRSSLYGKLFGLAAVKFATLDPSGMGVEMEADKPGWCDALNGLPGMFGSSMSETYELKRLVRMLTVIGDYPGKRFKVPAEIWKLVVGIVDALTQYYQDKDDHGYWDWVSTLREEYRAEVRLGITGEETELDSGRVMPVLQEFERKIELGLQRAVELNGGIPATYFVHEPREWKPITDESGNIRHNASSQVKVRVERFEPRPLPLFLEGMVKGVKLADTVEDARVLYGKVKESELYDRKLGMYKVNGSLLGEPQSIGRIRAYTPGWLENASIFLHMHYKYLLSVLGSGLYSEFWEECRRGLVPFFDPQVYGRSVLENSSFIASSDHPDSSLHGRGYVARLSGATVEFINMWFRATVGDSPFIMTDEGLALELNPALPGWLFREDGTLSFTFLGGVEVVYHNPQRQDLYPGGGLSVERMSLKTASGETVELDGGRIGPDWAEKVRDKQVRRIEAFLGSRCAKDERQNADCMEIC